MFKTALVYRIEQWDTPPLADLESRLAGAAFVECGPTQPESAGWVAPRGGPQGPHLESVGGQWILELCTETKAVPGAVVRTRLDQQLTRLEHETGRRPRGKLAREIKEAIVHELLPRAFPKQSTTRIWIDRAAGRVVIGAASAKRADAVLTRLVEQLGGGFRISPVQTALAPATAMAAWLSEKQAPAGFSIDRECELQQPDNDKAAVRYARHTLDIDEVGEHIRHGKLPTQLALTWAGRVSFVLTESLALKKIRWLELALEAGAAAGAGDDGGFDADVALSTGELQRLIPDLLEALGGEAPVDTPAAPAPTPTELRAPLPPPSP